MAQFIKWPAISQFRHVVAAFRYLFPESVAGQGPAAALTYKGTVKLHGCNASVVCTPSTGAMRYQGREAPLSAEATNLGFYAMIVQHEAQMQSLCQAMLAALPADGQAFLTTHPEAELVIYGEWCGRGIQRKCAIHQLDPMYVVFRAGLAAESPEDVASEDRPFYWLPDSQVSALMDEPSLKAARIFFTDQFPTYLRTFDFTQPESVLEEASALTAAVEASCPVGAALGVQGIGEGIVWRCVTPGYEHPRFWFKTKGDAHKNSKIKDQVEANPEEFASLSAMVANTVTEARLEQARSYLAARGQALSPQIMGDFLQWVAQDILKEEADLIAAAGLDVKKLRKCISTAAKAWLSKQPEFSIG